uniref:hypothetical protein n=1 Tax=Thaumasiovibrio occultus TaxID=1891184 RepID=UPI000B351ED5|nr:hypothetical protein [Thaumasiovibrio occultus]
MKKWILFALSALFLSGCGGGEKDEFIGYYKRHSSFTDRTDISQIKYDGEKYWLVIDIMESDKSRPLTVVDEGLQLVGTPAIIWLSEDESAINILGAEAQRITEEEALAWRTEQENLIAEKARLAQLCKDFNAEINKANALEGDEMSSFLASLKDQKPDNCSIRDYGLRRAFDRL